MTGEPPHKTFKAAKPKRSRGRPARGERPMTDGERSKRRMTRLTSRDQALSKRLREFVEARCPKWTTVEETADQIVFRDGQARHVSIPILASYDEMGVAMYQLTNAKWRAESGPEVVDGLYRKLGDGPRTVESMSGPEVEALDQYERLFGKRFPSDARPMPLNITVEPQKYRHEDQG